MALVVVFAFERLCTQRALMRPLVFMNGRDMNAELSEFTEVVSADDAYMTRCLDQ